MTLFNLPKRAIADKFLAKSKFYEKAKVNSKTQQEFTQGIERITWAYKLAESTINILGTKNIEELQIFNLTLKTKEIPKGALKAIDKAIPFAILYVFQYQNDVAYGITVKENNEQRYFFSDWNEKLNFDFTGNTIEHIYQKLIKLFISAKTGLTVKNENFEEILEKEKQLAMLNRDIASLEKKIHTEKQFNKQVDYNKILRKKLEERTVLKKKSN